MKSKSIPRLLAIIGAAALAALAPSIRAAKFPPLNTPAIAEHRPGKLVWADLFTTDPEGAAKFYCSLFGWTAATLEQKGKGYTVFRNEGRPVAGLAPRSVRGANHPSRWIGYLAVTDIASAVTAASREGGIVRAPARNFPARGYQAIVTDREGVPIGLLQSSSGDAPDAEPQPGDWNWFELYLKDPAAGAEFYHRAIGFDAAPDAKPGHGANFILASAGRARGGVAPLPEGGDAAPSWLGVVRVADLDEILARVPRLGGEVLVAPHPVEFGSRFAIILDSTGGTVGLVQYDNNANPANRP